MFYVTTFINFILRSTFSSSFPGMRRFWLFCYLMADVICCYIYYIHFPWHILLQFSRHEKVLAILLPHDRCYILLHLTQRNTFFAPVFPAWEGFSYFVTSWPMLSAATFINFILRRTFRSSFPGIRRFGLGRSYLLLQLFKFIFFDMFCIVRLWHVLLSHGRFYLLPHLFIYPVKRVFTLVVFLVL